MTLTDDVTVLIDYGLPGGGLGIAVDIDVKAADQVVVKVVVFSVCVRLGFGDQAVADQFAMFVRAIQANR